MPINSIKHSSKFFLAFIFFTALTFSYFGCESKKEEVKSTDENAAAVDSINKESVDAAKTDLGMNKIPDLTGTWNGVLDSRNTTLKITSQDSTSFKGKITINYREVINQEVKGSLNPEKMTVTMNDQIHSRYMGKYNAKLSSDTTKLSGTFTMNVDGKKLNFSLTKK
ncbi:MAG: hypothetical protein ABI550_09945 [Ignavibacteriaceae bacterium]